MIEAVHERGYPQTLVAHVIALAGVSRRAFYEQFANKEACFLATYDIVVARARKVALDAWTRERGWDNRLRGSLKALLSDIADHPNGPHLVLVDSLGIGPRAGERLRLAASSFERVLAMAFQVDPRGEELSALNVKAIVAGIRHITFMRMYQHREKELYSLADEILDWIESYRSPATERLNVSDVTRLGDARPRVAAFLSGEDSRSRVLNALVHLTLDERYSELSDSQIARFANLSDDAFHELFADKEACFLAVLDEFVAEAIQAVKGVIEHASSWPEAVHLAVRELVAFFASHEALSRLAFIEIFDVGPGMIDRMMRPAEDFMKQLDGPGPEARRGPLVAREAITGAIWGIVSAYAFQDRVKQLPYLADQLTFIVLAPYLEPDAAIEVIESARGR